MADELKPISLPSDLIDAKGKEWRPPACAWPRLVRTYDGFPNWVTLRAMPGREERSAKWFKRYQQPIYLPTFCKQERTRGKLHRPRLYAMLPGLLFAPDEIMDIDRRDEAFDEAGVRYQREPSGRPVMLTKAEVEIIREIEGRLNVPAERGTYSAFTVKQKIRFKRDLYAAFWGTGTVFEVASESRIGVEVEQAIGSCCKVYVPASEIEAM